MVQFHADFFDVFDLFDVSLLLTFPLQAAALQESRFGFAHRFRLNQPLISTENMEINEAEKTFSFSAPIISSTEAERLIENLQKLPIQECGTPR